MSSIDDTLDDSHSNALGRERLQGYRRQLGGLILIFGLCIVNEPLTTLSNGIGKSPQTDRPLDVAIVAGALSQVLIGVWAVLVGVAALLMDKSHFIPSMILVGLVATSIIPIVSELLELGDEGTAPYELATLSDQPDVLDSDANNTSTQTAGQIFEYVVTPFIPDEYLPTTRDVRFFASMGIFAVLMYSIAMFGGLALSGMALLSVDDVAQGRSFHTAGHYRCYHLVFTFVLVLAGMAQLLLGAYCFSEYQSGPLEPTMGVAMLVVRYPELSMLVGGLQMVVGYFGIARYLSFAPVGPDNHEYQMLLMVAWVSQLGLQYLTQVGIGDPQDRQAMHLPALALFSVGLHLLPAYLDFQMRTAPKQLPQSYFALPTTKDNRRRRKDRQRRKRQQKRDEHKPKSPKYQRYYNEEDTAPPSQLNERAPPQSGQRQHRKHHADDDDSSHSNDHDYRRREVPPEMPHQDSFSEHEIYFDQSSRQISRSPPEIDADEPAPIQQQKERTNQAKPRYFDQQFDPDDPRAMPTPQPQQPPQLQQQQQRRQHQGQYPLVSQTSATTRTRNHGSGHDTTTSHSLADDDTEEGLTYVARVPAMPKPALKKQQSNRNRRNDHHRQKSWNDPLEEGSESLSYNDEDDTMQPLNRPDPSEHRLRPDQDIQWEGTSVQSFFSTTDEDNDIGAHHSRDPSQTLELDYIPPERRLRLDEQIQHESSRTVPTSNRSLDMPNVPDGFEDDPSESESGEGWMKYEVETDVDDDEFDTDTSPNANRPTSYRSVDTVSTLGIPSSFRSYDTYAAVHEIEDDNPATGGGRNHGTRDKLKKPQSMRSYDSTELIPEEGREVVSGKDAAFARRQNRRKRTDSIESDEALQDQPIPPPPPQEVYPKNDPPATLPSQQTSDRPKNNTAADRNRRPTSNNTSNNVKTKIDPRDIHIDPRSQVAGGRGGQRQQPRQRKVPPTRAGRAAPALQRGHSNATNRASNTSASSRTQPEFVPPNVPDLMADSTPPSDDDDDDEMSNGTADLTDRLDELENELTSRSYMHGSPLKDP